MLVELFKRRMTFSVGTSLTTGQTNTTVWAGVHHKSSKNPGPFGYPDPTYLSRVAEELKMRGIEPTTVQNSHVSLNSGTITI